MLASLLDSGGWGLGVVGRDHHEPFARVLHDRVAGVACSGRDVVGDARSGAVGHGDLLRAGDRSGGGVGQRIAHRVADRDDSVGGGGPSLALRLLLRTRTREEEHGDCCEQCDHHEGGRPQPPPLSPPHAHGWITAALSARRFPFARNGTPILAAFARSSTRW